MFDRRPLSRGFSLLELMISILLLLAGFGVFAALFQSGLQHSSVTNTRSKAALIAQNQIEEIRVWAQQPNGAGYNFDDWSSWSSYSAPAAEDSAFTVEVSVQDWTLANPCTQFEAPHSDQRLLSACTKKVGVTVRWTQGEVELTTLIGEPRRELGSPSLIIAPSSGVSLGPNESADFTVQAFDAGGQAILDPFFDWSLVAVTGNGTLLETSRSGVSCRLTHHYTLPNGVVTNVPGRCRLFVTLRYHGTPATDSIEVELR